MSRPKFSHLVSLVVLSLAAVVAGAACESPTVGDACGTCGTSTKCEPVCPCGNASCQAYECVGTSDGGLFVYADGGPAKSCSQL